MPMCLMVGCSRKTGRGKGVRLYRVPAIITNQSPEVEELSIERRRLWISAISRADLTEKIEDLQNWDSIVLIQTMLFRNFLV